MVWIPNNYITQTINNAFAKVGASPRDLRKLVYYAVDVLCREDRNSKDIIRPVAGTLMKLDIKAFKYNGCYYYWWDLLDDTNEWIASGLEFYPFSGDDISYVLFATRIGQAPFIFREKIRYY